MASEDWRQVPDFPSYEASSLGRIRNSASGLVRKTRVNWGGYAHVTLSQNGRPFFRGVHRLVASAFHGQCPHGREVNHKDGDKVNNAPENLEYLTRSENNKHAFAIGLKSGTNFPIYRGSAHGRAKLTEADVETIRRLHKDVSNVALAANYRVSVPTIEAIVYRRTWKHVA
jgi:hypothetical protein